LDSTSGLKSYHLIDRLLFNITKTLYISCTHYETEYTNIKSAFS